jgi:maltose alpha-D-glucosyltransferase/alpha-amylase
VGLLTDAFATSAFARIVMDGLVERKRIPITNGEILFYPTDHFLETHGDIGQLALEWPAAEQTNSTLTISRRFVIKLLRRLSSGVHPEGEMSRYLTDKGFAGTPPLLGEMLRQDEGGVASTVAIVQTYVFNQGDGWRWTLDYLTRVVDENAMPFSPDAGLGSYDVFAAQIGLRLGEMHRILAEPSDNPAFAPEYITPTRAAAIATRILAQFDAALAAARTSRDSEISAVTRELAAQRATLSRIISERASLATDMLRTRIHGDLHLGQLLVAGEDVQIIDFEGEPLKSLEDRRHKDLPLRDLAGMLRSFDYAAAHAEREAKQAKGGEGLARVAHILDEFRKASRQKLLEGYERGLGRAFTEREWALLDLLMLEKAAYEVCYEAAYRPDWLAVPLHSLSALGASVTASEVAHA